MAYEEGQPAPMQGRPEREASGAYKGRCLPAETPPAGAAATHGNGPPQGATTRSQPCYQQGRRRRPQGWLPTGKGSYRLRRGYNRGKSG
ncbi:hypothetical protein B296_00044462 [Ensete ventricosum]|uniref:Uncharacterized protein n=1 Tax=Ensete ventricosum TaxID=4639 RepID=A0A426WYI2_ENSVE|nr:hypothetical protein B296_00044462 [Ensete ventricosum]